MSEPLFESETMERAATISGDGLYRYGLHRWWGRGDRLVFVKAERDAALAAVDRVRRLHGQYSSIGLAPGEWCPGCGHPEPCPTIRALGGGDTGEGGP